MRERDRVEREIKKTEKDFAAIEKKLALPSFVDKAPQLVVQEAHQNRVALQRKLAQLREALALVDELL